MVRFAHYNDIDQLVRMGEHFFNVSGYNELGEYDPIAVMHLLTRMINRREVVIDNEGKYGMLGWVQAPFYMMPSKTFCTELFWWVEPEKRGTRLAISMLNFVEKVAKQRQASALCMITLDGNNVAGVDAAKTAKLYERLNFKPKEQTFIKPL